MQGMFPPERLCSISSANGFLPTLAHALASGHFWPDVSLDDRWMVLAQTRIFLPSRRACRVLKDELIKASGSAVILPNIQALGDLGHDDDPDDILFDEVGDSSSLPEAIDPTHQLHVLAQFVAKWQTSQSLDNETPSLGVDSFPLALELGKLLGVADTYAIDWRRLDTIDVGSLSDSWQIVQDFLMIVTRAWPDYLKEIGAVSTETRRKLSIQSLASFWQKHPVQTPVIIAGSTGSQPASRRLMMALSALPRGFLVLPDLDKNFSEEARKLDDLDLASYQHPQTALRILLQSLAVSPDLVADYGAPLSKAQKARDHFLHEVLRHAEDTAKWASVGERLSDQERQEALEGLTLIRAQTPHAEALALALALRRVLETPEKNAILVTPDRLLAERVAGELKRFNIHIDDSAGQSLTKLPLTRLCLDCADLAAKPFHPLAFLSLLDQPMVHLNIEPWVKHRGREALELILFRASPCIMEWSSLQEAYKARRRAAHADKLPSGFDPLLTTLSDELWRDGETVLEAMVARLDPLFQLFSSKNVKTLGAITTCHHEVFLSLIDESWIKSKGQEAVLLELNKQLTSFEAPLVANLTVEPHRYPALLASLFASQSVRGAVKGIAEPRLAILGPLEARLQTADVMVLGGLVDGVWPSTAGGDPWLSRSMRAHLGFEPPEARLGLAAHDWQSFMRAPEVIMSYAQMVDGKPAIPSRWLQRLEAVATTEGMAAVEGRGQTLLDWVKLLDKPKEIAPWPHPKPCLKAQERAERVSITEIEPLLVNPYGFYARKALGLTPLNPIGGVLGARELGTLIHNALERFLELYPLSESLEPESAAVDRLISLLNEAMEVLNPNAATRTLWRGRFTRLATWYVAWEKHNRNNLCMSFTEISGHLPLDLISGRSVTLSGRADRIDITKDGALRLIDYKTGAIPTDATLKKYHAPQLYLGAALALRKAYADSLADIGANGEAKKLLANISAIDDLLYIKVTGQQLPIGVTSLNAIHDQDSLASISEALLAKVTDLMNVYDQDDKPYLAVQGDKNAQRYDDYAHLARFSEWHNEAGFGGGGDDD